MNRAVFSLALAAALTALTVACNDSTTSDHLQGAEDPQTSRTPDDTPTTTAKAEAPTTTTTAPADAGAASSSTSDCSATTSAKDCSTCCAKKADPRSDLKTCACTAGSTCASACQKNVCNDKLPDLACSMCLLTATCTFDNPIDDVEACFKTSACESKP